MSRMPQETTGSEIAAVAITGCAGRFPGAPDLEAFWRNLAAGVESIAFFTPQELRAAGVPEEMLRDPKYVPACGLLDDAEAFDAGLFGMSPREARATDPQHRLFLEQAWAALEDAGCDPARFPGLVGVFAGSSLSRYMLAVHADPDLGPTLDPYQLAVGNDKDFLATRASYKLGLEGPAFTVQTACSTSLVAVHLACQSLLNGECDLALAGGVSAPWPQQSGYLWTEGMVLSPDGHCRAFDERGEGTVAGQGVGIVVLRRLEDALAARDSIRAVIRGSAINNDGSRKVGYTAPRVEGQARAIRSAQVVAELDDARRITYVEAHGTGTPLGDPIEIAALTRAFRATTKETGFCAVGSVKTNIGHLDAAAGVAGLIKAMLALEHRQIPPSLHCEAPNPKIDFAGSPFFVNRELRDWSVEPSENAEPRLAAVSSFGIGGTNAHAVLEEAPEPEPSGPSREHQLLVLSARTADALEAAAERLAANLESRSDLPDVAFTLRMGRRELEHRRAVVCTDRDSAITALRAPARISGVAKDGVSAAFLFPGLGGQHPGMASGLLAEEPLFRREIETCAEILRPLLGFDPMTIFRPDSPPETEERLGDIAVSMPLLFALEQSLGRLWMSWGVTPKALLGHSLGEYAAACLAGVFGTEDGLRIMAARGRLLAELPPGGMISVPLAEQECAPLLVPGSLWLATINGPRTCVLSGTPEALDEVEARLASQGKTARRVRARGAYHSGMIDGPMLERFRAEVARVKLAEPSIPFLSNLTGTWIQAGQATDPGYWTEHLRSPVRFADDLAELLRDPSLVPVELGPGRTLATLAAERLGGTRPALTSLRHPQEAAEDAAVLYGSLGRLWAEGVPVDWSRFAADERRRRVRLPTYPFERQVHTVARLAPAKAEPERPDDRFQVPVWKQTPPLEPSDRPGGPWLVFTPGADPISARLEARGDAVARVEVGERFRRLGSHRYEIDPGRPEDYDALLAALDEDGFAPAGVVHAWSLARTAMPRSLSDLLALAEAATALGFHSLLFLAQAFGRRGSSLRLTVLSEGLHRIAGETAPAPERATLLGPVLVIPREMPGAVCRSVDLTVSEEALDTLVAELDGGQEPVVALRDGSRWVPGFEPVRLEAPTTPADTRLREGGTYLITGGLGAMGLAFAERFAREARVKLALLSRSTQSAGARDRVRRIEALGSEVMVVRADAADPESMAAAVAAVRERFGPIHGAVHAAGILGAGLLQGRTREAVDAVLAPKVRGTLILDHLLRGEPLDFLLLCSSVSALSGVAGQVDYCAANAFLDAFARWRGRPAVSVDWDRWKGEGMAHAATGRTEVHPLLGARVDGGAGRIVFASILGAARTWALDEHRLLDRPVLPGTAYLEMARAACEAVAGAGPVEIADVLFWTPLIVPAGREVEVHTLLDPRDDGSFTFQVVSDGAIRHASGSIRRLDPAAAAAVRERAGRVLERIAALDAAPGVEPGPDSFGPRWQCLRRYRFAGDEGLADLALDDAFAADLDTYRLHLSLLDAATGFPSAALTEAVHLPLSYRAVRILAPLAPAVRSWGRGRGAEGGTFSADLVITGLDGEPLVEIEEFTKRQVDPGQDQADLASRSPVNFEVEGIEPEVGLLPHEGAEALIRILGSRRRLAQVVVSAPVRKRAAPAVRQERPAAPIPSVADAGVEETLRRLWSEVLGVPEVGLHDNFFTLGGDSILGLQVVARARDAGLELTPGQIFEHQTVAQLAAVLRSEKPQAAESPSAVTTGDFPLAGMDEAGLGQLFEQLAVIDSIADGDEP